MKKYIAPSVVVTALNAENMIALSANNEKSEQPMLSNRAEDLDMDWDEE